MVYPNLIPFMGLSWRSRAGKREDELKDTVTAVSRARQTRCEENAMEIMKIRWTDGIASCVLLLLVFTGCEKNGIEPGTENNVPLHESITATVFWIGEEGNEDNGYIPNIQSAWDDKWMERYGGTDDPNGRKGYFPAGFTPLENPFYFALPYNDFDADGKRKPAALELISWAKTTTWGSRESMCKNRWIEITKGRRTAYAQWEDVGPFGEDDAKYVFGDAAPQNERNDRAGLDVSPAVRDYLGLSGIDKVNLRFISAENVPSGPWKEIMTDSQVYWE